MNGLAAIAASCVTVFAVLTVAGCAAEADADERFTPKQVNVRLDDGRVLLCVQAVRNGGLSCNWDALR